MTDTVDELLARRAPTAARPLLGLTLLLVEDSRFASEAMRMLCLRSGARLRRADTLRAARRHLSAYRPCAVSIDLGLPDGSGLELIEELARTEPDLPLIATSGDDGTETAARAAGAQEFLGKPVPSLGNFQSTLLACLPAEAQPRGPRIMSSEPVHPDGVALQDDLAHAAELLRAPADPETHAYVAQFLGGVARAAGDVDLEQAAAALHGSPGDTSGLAALISARMTTGAAL